MSRGLRKHGDVFGDIPDMLTDIEPERPRPKPRLIMPRRPRFDPKQGRFSSSNCFPENFCPGTGRVRLLNDRLLPMYNGLGLLRNGLEHEHNYVFNSGEDGLVFDELVAGYKKLKREFDNCCGFVSAAVGEIHALGGEVYIPDALKDVVTLPLLPHGCLSRMVHQYIAELQTVDHRVPIGRCIISCDLIISGNNNWTQWPIGKYNSALGKLYGELAFRVNRFDCLKALYDDDQFSEAVDRNVMKGHLDQLDVMYKTAVEMVSAKLPTNAAEIFMMPIDLRDKVLAIFMSVKRQPIYDVSVLYNTEIQKYQGKFCDPDFAVNLEDLSNFRRMLTKADAERLISDRGGIFNLARSTTDEVVRTDVLLHAFHRTVFRYLSSYEKVFYLHQIIAEYVLKALRVDIAQAQTTVRSSAYGEWLLVRFQDEVNSLQIRNVIRRVFPIL